MEKQKIKIFAEQRTDGTHGTPARKRGMTFREAEAVATNQVKPELYRGMHGEETREYRIALSCVRLIADMYTKGESVLVCVDGEEKLAGDVAEVYRHLDARTVYAMISELRLADVSYIRAYLRTALYRAALVGWF